MEIFPFGLAVTVETEFGDALRPFRAFFSGEQMAGKTGPVPVGRRRQGVARFMAGTSQLFSRHGRVQLTCLLFSQRQLVVGVVTANTALILLGVFDSFFTMQTIFELVRDMVMTGHTLIRGKKICQFLFDICRIRMTISSRNVLMAVLQEFCPWTEM